MMSDTWGCGSSSFGGGFGFDSAKSLSELVDNLSNKSNKSAEKVLETSFPLAESQVHNVQVIPCVIKKKSAPKILKKKSSINKSKEPNAKRVSFEVEQLLSREATGIDKNEARDRLVISLGGLPEKKRAMNYKTLKEEILSKKLEAKSKTEMLGYLPNRVVLKKTKSSK